MINARISRIVTRIKWEIPRFIEKSGYRVRKLFKYDFFKNLKIDIPTRRNIFYHGIKSSEKFAGLREISTVAADKAINHKVYMLHGYRENIFDIDAGHYRWLYDYVTSYKYPMCYYSDVRKKIPPGDNDIKRVWELSRLQYLFAPALSWYLTGIDRYADYVLYVINDWIDVNTYEEGPNWNIGMEVGIRAVNIILATQLIDDYSGYNNQLRMKIYKSLQLHLKFLMQNLENYRGVTYNHYIADILGILAISAAYPDTVPGSFEYAYNSFEREIRKQTLTDGGIYEGSSCYHCLSGEMFSIAAMITENIGNKFSDSYYNHLKKIYNYSLSLRKPNGNMPQIGDNDGGRIIELAPHEPLNYNMYFTLTENLLSNKTAPVDVFHCLDNISNDYNENGPGKLQLFSDSRIAVYKDSSIYCSMSAVETQQYGLGGHTHNDKLSIEICYKSKDFIVDPGTGVYSSDLTIHHSFRSVKNHSTVCVAGCEQNESQVIGFFGNSYNTKSELYVKNKQPYEISGLARINNSAIQYEHNRIMQIFPQKIIISDKVLLNQSEQVEYNFVLHPNVIIRITEGYAVLNNDGVTIKVSCEDMTPIKKSGFYSDKYDHYCPTDILCFKSVCPMGLTERTFYVYFT